MSHYYSEPLLDRNKHVLNPDTTLTSTINMWITCCTGGMSIQAKLFPFSDIEPLPENAQVEMRLFYSNDPEVFEFQPLPDCVYTITKDAVHITIGEKLKIARYIKVTFTNLSTARVRCHVTPCFV